MKRTIIILVAMIAFIAANAKEFTYTFNNTPISQAIVKISQDHPDANIAFIYKELDNYITSATIDTDDINVALRQIIGFHPIMLSTKKGIYYVEALQHGRFTYTGQVVDSEKEPLPCASVLLINPRDSVVVTYGATAQDGTFSIPCDRKNLTAKVSCVGYMTTYQNSDNCNVGVITLRENPITLRSITVEEDAVILSPDKNTYMPTQRQKQFSSTGFDLLSHMAIPTLIVTPGSNTITDVFGNVCEIFINFTPASNDDLNAMNIANARKIEVYDSPADPRFRGARKAINIVVQEYAYGGYSKFMASETTLNGFSNKSNIYNKFTYKRMTYDLYVGVANNNNSHSGSDTKSQFTLNDGEVTRNETTTTSKNILNSFPVTFRASLNSTRLQLQNLVSFTHESSPEQSYSGQLSFNNNFDKDYNFTRSNSSRLNSFNYNGSLYWWHPRDFAIDYSHSLSYDHRNNSSAYFTDAVNIPIVNDAVENRTSLKLNLYGLKAFGSKHRVRLGGRFIYLNDIVDYPTNVGSTDHLKTTTGGITTQYTFSTKKFNLSANLGFGFERISANNTTHTEKTPFGDVNFWWKISNKNSLTAYASYGVWTPGVDMRQDMVIRDNEYLYLTGNSSLANYQALNTNLAYNFYANNKFNMAAFVGCDEYFNRVATIYSPYGNNALIRSYINNGNYSNLYAGASANLKLFNNSLQLYANITQKFFKSSGLYDSTLSPLRIQLQASYYWKSFYVLASWGSKNSTLTENSNIVIRNRQSYLIEAGWGNGTWVVSLTAKNIFRNKWDSDTWSQETPLYSKWETLYSPKAHASLNLTVTYTIGYGKKTRRANEVGAYGSSPSAIIKH
ncbi:MAG: TonB-dependent receptor family protein [Odoribacter sp.]|nr:TonB-dependent receptor family protein [Odoribacter sp.]